MEQQLPPSTPKNVSSTTPNEPNASTIATVRHSNVNLAVEVVGDSVVEGDEGNDVCNSTNSIPDSRYY